MGKIFFLLILLNYLRSNLKNHQFLMFLTGMIACKLIEQVALVGASCLIRVDPGTGKEIMRLRLPTNKPTACTFGI